MIYFTSDTHFGHKNIIKYYNRPSTTVDEMDQLLIDRWNEKIKKDDQVYHLGDCFWNMKLQKAREIRKQLNGRIYLIKGNHEHVAEQLQKGGDLSDMKHFNPPFEWIKDYYELMVEGQRIILFHYPMRSWNFQTHGSWHLYGHCHGSHPPVGLSFDIGVDCWNCYPLSFDEVKHQMALPEVKRCIA